MPAYLMVQSTITDRDQYQKYVAAVAPLILKHGGKFVARGATVEVLEGRHDGRKMGMVEFSTIQALHAFWDDPEYVPVKKIRQGAATLDVWAVDGI